MNYRFLAKTLVSNVHLLIISLVIATLGLSALGTPDLEPQTATKQSKSTFEFSTGPVTPSGVTGSSSDVSTTSQPSTALQTPQNQSQPSTSTSNSKSTDPTTPILPSADPITDGCTGDCTLPAPTPRPTPPASGCGTCGSYIGPRPQHVMCPMYCLEAAN